MWPVRSSASSWGWSSGSPTDRALEQSSHHVIGVLAVSWTVVAAAMVLAVLAAYFAASGPARAVSRIDRSGTSRPFSVLQM